MADRTVYYVDTSAFLRSVLLHSPAARAWFESPPGDLVASTLLRAEATRALINLGVRDPGLDLTDAREALDGHLALINQARAAGEWSSTLRRNAEVST